jgi:hypothetical protein
VRLRLARIERERAAIARLRIDEAAFVLQPQSFLIEGGGVGQS